MTVTLWPDLIAWIILGLAGFYALGFLWMTMMFTEFGERLLTVLVLAVPFFAIVWALSVVL